MSRQGEGVDRPLLSPEARIRSSLRTDEVKFAR